LCNRNETCGVFHSHFLLIDAHRDSAGRTRTENPLNISRLSLPEVVDVPLIHEIFDPVAGYCYYLDAYNSTAYRVALPRPIQKIMPLSAPEQTENPLGTKMIAGVEAKGSFGRSTLTLSSGRPTISELETWYSYELQVGMSSVFRTIDLPYISETVYTIVNLNRSEPDDSFFRIPENYKIVDPKLPFTFSFRPSVSSRVNLQSIFDYATVNILLTSSDSKEQAWGAWLAGEGQMSELIPLLQQIVEKRLNGEDWIEDGLPMNAALEALIKLSFHAPAELLSTIYPKWPVHTLILMSKWSQFFELAPAEAAFLLDLAAKEKGYNWFAANNLLLKHRVPGMAVMLLRNLEVNAELFARSEEDLYLYSLYLGGDAGLTIFDGVMISEQGYPPLTYYYLTGANSGNTLLADGPTSVYYRRNVSGPARQSGTSSHVMSGRPTNIDIFQYLERLLNRSGGTLPLRASEYRDFILNEQKSLESEISDFRADILKRYELLLKIFMDANLLTEEEKDSLPSMKINLQVKYPPKPGQ